MDIEQERNMLNLILTTAVSLFYPTLPFVAHGTKITGK